MYLFFNARYVQYHNNIFMEVQFVFRHACLACTLTVMIILFVESSTAYNYVLHMYALDSYLLQKLRYRKWIHIQTELIILLFNDCESIFE